jgi:hypothetical protein
MVLYAYVCAFSLHRDSPGRILGDKPLLFQGVCIRVVKITCSTSKVVLQTMNHTVIYLSLGSLIGGNSPTSSGLILKMNMCYKGVIKGLEKFTW